MNVGEAARRVGLPVKTMHYYEDIRLVVPGRQHNGYRDYSDDDVYKLRFVQRARSLGFTVEDCRALLSLYQDPERASADVRRIAKSHLEGIETKLSELQSLRDALYRLVESCHGDQRARCPILDDLAGAASPDPH